MIHDKVLKLSAYIFISLNVSNGISFSLITFTGIKRHEGELDEKVCHDREMMFHIIEETG